MNVEMQCVRSSNIVAVGYDKRKLYVEYKRGTYVYKDVPKDKYDALLKAESKGKYLCANIKGSYDYERVE